MAHDARDLKSLVEEVKRLEDQIKLVKSAQTTRESCAALISFVKANEHKDPLVIKTSNNVFQTSRRPVVACTFILG